MWLSIRQDQLIKVPSVEVCRQLAVAEPERRKVSTKLHVKFQGAEYDVSGVPGVMVHEYVLITRNPWRDDAAQVVSVDAQGREVYYVVPVVARNELGFDGHYPGHRRGIQASRRNPGPGGTQGSRQGPRGTTRRN